MRKVGRQESAPWHSEGQKPYGCGAVFGYCTRIRLTVVRCLSSTIPRSDVLFSNLSLSGDSISQGRLRSVLWPYPLKCWRIIDPRPIACAREPTTLRQVVRKRTSISIPSVFCVQYAGAAALQARASSRVTCRRGRLLLRHWTGCAEGETSCASHAVCALGSAFCRKRLIMCSNLTGVSTT